MAERALIAFGRYVRMLRDRRGLSLDDAAALTRVYPSPLNKGYVSRVERGLTRVGFEKMIAVARAYDVSVDVLAERLWLDLELDTTAPPDTSGGDLAEMIGRAERAARRGLLWQAYAHMRDALVVGVEGPVAPRFSTREEQIAICCADLGSTAMRLGAFRFALQEMEFARTLLSQQSQHTAIIAIHLASLHRRMGDLAAARVFADEAVAHSDNGTSLRYRGYAYSTRGILLQAQQKFSEAIEDFTRSIEAFRASGLDSECPINFVNIAQSYFDLNRRGAARRALSSAERPSDAHVPDQVRARSRILLGQIHEAEGNHERASRLWRDAADIARQSRDRTLLFKADFLIYRRAVQTGNNEIARAFAKKLIRISRWILQDIPELREFHALNAQHPAILRRPRRVVR